MIPLILVGILAAASLTVSLVSQGYANTIDELAYKLHRHAVATRKRFQKHDARLSQQWFREFEQNGEDIINIADIREGKG